jgi:hypothetical protein
MKPDLMDGHDKIESMLDKGWETMPTHLEKRLLAVPIQLQSVAVSPYDKFAFALNSLLVVWALGLIYFFKDLISLGTANISIHVVELGALLPFVMTHPGFLVLGIGILGVTWWSFDLDFS